MSVPVDLTEAQPFFGAPWPSGVCEHGRQEPTPVGERCGSCDEEIVDGDCGWWWHAENGPKPRSPIHRECGFRDVAGSVGHMLGKCSCFGGDMEDPPGFTRREAAKMAYAWAQTYWSRG